MTREEFGRRFKAAREATGLTQAEAAERLGVRQPRIAEYEKGRAVPLANRLDEIVRGLGFDPKTLFSEWFEKD